MKALTASIDSIIVQFKGHLRPFQVIPYQCDNPDCPCKGVTLEFTEVEDDGSVVSMPIYFRFVLDLETWQKRKDTNHNEQINALINEFVHDLSDEMKAMFIDGYEQKKEWQRKFANFTMPAEDIRQSRLISLSEVMSDKKDYDGVPRYGFKFTSQDQTYYIDDLYCPNPKCGCKEVYLMFLKHSEKTDGKSTLAEAFLAALSLDGKKLTFLELCEYSESQATALVHHWQQTEPDALDMFKHRYMDIRKAAKRILKNSRTSPKRDKIAASFDAESQRGTGFLSVMNMAETLMPPVSSNKDFLTNLKTGRNAPCPCGSGKKYKKCCGS